MARILRIAAYILIATACYASLAQAASAASANARHAIKPAPRVTVTARGKVLHGDLSCFTGVATVNRRAVFEAIPAYQQLRREKLSKRDPRYLFLLTEANRVFNRTLDRACIHFGVDLVIEDGNVRAVGLEVIPLTEAMTKAVCVKRGAAQRCSTR